MKPRARTFGPGTVAGVPVAEHEVVDELHRALREEVAVGDLVLGPGVADAREAQLDGHVRVLVLASAFANETTWIGGNRSSVQPFMIIIGAGLPRPLIHSGDRYSRTCRQIGSTSDAVYGSPSSNVSSQSGRAAPRSCSADANCPVAVPSR